MKKSGKPRGGMNARMMAGRGRGKKKGAGMDRLYGVTSVKPEPDMAPPKRMSAAKRRALMVKPI